MTLDLLDDIGRGVLATLAYAGVGALVLTVGYLVLDAITPGKLRHLVYTDHNRNAAVLASANILALGAIMTTSIVRSSDDLARGLLEAGFFGLMGVLLLAVSFKVLDAVTPGHLGAIVTDPTSTPAVWVTAAFQIALGAVLSAAVS